MKCIQKLFIRLTIFSTLFFLPLSAFAAAGPTMTVSTSTAVPTLSGAMLVILSLLLFAVAVRIAKQKNSAANKMFVTLLGVGSISLVTGGAHIISKADAALHGAIIDYTSVVGSMAGERTISLNAGGQGYNLFTNNTSGAVVNIIDINEDGFNCDAPPPGTMLDNDDFTARIPVPENETCMVGMTLRTGESCDLYCDFISD